MVATVEQFVMEFGGSLVDSNRELVTQDTLESWHKKIKSYERKQINFDLFSESDL